ncbi:hypothetical protein EVAR_97100_1 [Eumeta japonica]|uniref:Uncharacterized protein n=1 Tax=Eumeta variegata TaxID=151549 RepID=A0A4C1X8Z0_EUMVA|nr:hypothetical protein EVAR_97100_1 [Eumeta japonica]
MAGSMRYTKSGSSMNGDAETRQRAVLSEFEFAFFRRNCPSTENNRNKMARRPYVNHSGRSGFCRPPSVVL